MDTGLKRRGLFALLPFAGALAPRLTASPTATRLITFNRADMEQFTKFHIRPAVEHVVLEAEALYLAEFDRIQHAMRMGRIVRDHSTPQSVFITRAMARSPETL